MVSHDEHRSAHASDISFYYSTTIQCVERRRKLRENYRMFSASTSLLTFFQPISQINWSKVIRLYFLLNICLIHAEEVHGDERHFNNAAHVFAACSEYIVEVGRVQRSFSSPHSLVQSFHNVTREFSLSSLDHADVCCQFFACLTQNYNQLMSRCHKETCICIVSRQS